MSVEALDMTQIRWHSRGGQGGMTASQMLAEATFRDGREATAFTFFGAERRG
ncbi:MAG: 2-oxoacid:acceptor oxidoreductase family protein, partial [Halodesulfurarchaeum sp.]